MKTLQINRIKLLTLCAVSALALGACSSARMVDEAASAKPAGSAFNQNLQKEYVALAKSELDQGDRRDAEHYAMKALSASKGNSVTPDTVAARDLGSADTKALNDARTRLTAALAGSEAAKKPADAAKAQSMFDCWLEQQEEGWQQADIDACHKGFDTAMAALAPEKMAAKPAEPQTVYFKFDSDELIPKSQGELADLIREVKLAKPKAVQIISYTDLSGDKAYNAKLAAMRGKSIEEKLKDAGAQVIKVDARGPVEPVIDTEKPNQQNRRAVIIMQ